MQRLAFLSLLLLACSPVEDDGGIELPPEGTGGGDPSAPPPVSAAELQAWLQDGMYRDWAPESAIHSSTGPHFGNVRTYVNTPLFDSLQAGAETHPIDASAVKELYGDGSDLLGWSVLVKVSDASFYWFEFFDGSTLADALDLGVCVNCHSGGTDHVLTPFPLQ